MYYPAAQPIHAPSIEPPSHPELTHYPRWGMTRQDNIEAFRNFLKVQNLDAELDDFDTRLASSADIHWALIAERYVLLHWVK